MDQHHFLIHGSIHGITADTMDHLRRFARAGGHVEMLSGQTDAIISYALPEGEEPLQGTENVIIESLLHILESAGEGLHPANGAHGVITYGWTHQEPSHLCIGAAESKGLPPARLPPASSLWDALKSLHLHSWFARHPVRHEQNH